MIERASRTVNGNEGCISAVDSEGRTIWIVDAHRDNGKRFVARADEKLAAFVELESAIRGSPFASLANLARKLVSKVFIRYR